MADEREDAPLTRLCRRVVGELRRDCLIRLALEMRGHAGGRESLHRVWRLASTDEDRRAVADAVAGSVDWTLQLTAMFVDLELAHERLAAVVEPSGAAPYRIRGDEWLWRVLEEMLFDPDRGAGERSSADQLFELATADQPVFGRPRDESAG